MSSVNRGVNRDTCWEQDSESSSSSSDADHPRSNTVEISNLPPGTTVHFLVEHLMVVGPFGKLYSVHIRNSQNDKGQPASEALVAFMDQNSPKILESFAAWHGFTIEGRPAYIKKSKNSSPDREEPEDRNDSRVLILEGPPRQIEIPGIRTMLKNNNVPEKNVERVVPLGSNGRGMGKVAVAFTNYASACKVLKAVNETTPATSLRAKYGVDPVDGGVRQGWRNGRRTVDVNSWEIKR